jgi:hydroxymethylglutaryl-CoA lyase
MAQIAIRDVAPRDGLQSERTVEPSVRAELAAALATAGIADIEAASFVSPKAVPSMAHGDEVFAALPELPGVRWWALVPNARGAELALAAGARHITVTVSASDGYSVKNVGRSTDEAIDGLAAIGAAASNAEANAEAIDVVVSCCFGSPFDDVAGASDVRDVIERVVAALPGAQVTLADTTGTATPRRIDAVLKLVPSDVMPTLGLHLHDTRGTALANAVHAVGRGITRFDTATGGLGGSPFAPGAGGNLATEDLVLMLHDLGHETDVDLERLLAIAADLAGLVGHAVPGRVAAAGGLPSFE